MYTLLAELVLASLIAGEAGAMGCTAQVAVGHVALNRYNAGIDSHLGEGFYGWAEPTPESLAAARTALRSPDSTDGALYALSKQDRHKLGFPPGDVVFVQGPWEIHVYREWP